MKHIDAKERLNAAIVNLENKKNHEWIQLKNQLHFSVEYFQPAHLLSEISASPGFKDKLVGGALGLASGYVSKVLVMGKNHGMLSSLLGTVVQFGVSALVAKNTNGIKMLAGSMAKLFAKKKAADTTIESNL